MDRSAKYFPACLLAARDKLPFLLADLSIGISDIKNGTNGLHH
jgi:hypothetical protein